MSEERKEYFFELGNINSGHATDAEKEEDIKKEKAIREFIWKHADVVRLTRSSYLHSKGSKSVQFTGAPLVNKKKVLESSEDVVDGLDNDPDFAAVINRFSKHFIKKMKNTKKFDDIEQGVLNEHYFYTLDESIKNMFNKETIFIHALIDSENFYGFDDPVFYKNNEMIACVIPHETYIWLYLTPEEEKEALTLGLVLKSF